MEHLKIVMQMSAVVAGGFAGLMICLLTPFWMAAAAGMI